MKNSNIDLRKLKNLKPIFRVNFAHLWVLESLLKILNCLNFEVDWNKTINFHQTADKLDKFGFLSDLRG